MSILRMRKWVIRDGHEYLHSRPEWKKKIKTFSMQARKSEIAAG